MENDFFYRKLNVYHQSKKLVADVYALTKVFPSQEQYGLTNQIQRAVVSIPSNIAEGMGRFSTKEHTFPGNCIRLIDRGHVPVGDY